MPNDYKTSKEAFVSDHSGSTVTHVNLISSVALCSIALHSAVRSRLPLNKTSNIFTEYILVVLPLLLSMTLFANNPLLLDVFLLVPTFLLQLRPPRVPPSLPSSHSNSRPSSPTELGKDRSNRPEVAHPVVTVEPLPALTTYRTHMLLMTFLSIIAVDFPIFPRSLAKCETFGVSLMDLGVGSFVFSQGIVSAIPLIKNPSYISAPLLPKFYTVGRKMLPLIFLGLLRVALVKGSDYPEHQSEYGTHWNFFLTLALLPPLQALLHSALLHANMLSIGLGITILHQLILSNTSLQSWTLNAPRSNIISHNKEGLVSLPGYLAIHILGLLTGTLLLPSSPSEFRRVQERANRGSIQITVTPQDGSKRRSRQYAKTAIELCSYAVVWWSLLSLSSLIGLGGGVSRRLANMRYVLWVSAFNTSFITAYLALDIFFFPSSSGKKYPPRSPNHLSPPPPSRTVKTPETLMTDISLLLPKSSILLEAINLNGLPLFLLANIATGLINLAVHTMYMSDFNAMAILSLYAFGISLVAWVLREKRVWRI